MLIASSLLIIFLVALIAVTVIPMAREKAEANRFAPSIENPDPSTGIAGVVSIDYPAGDHVAAPQTVAYDQSPPFGGPHDQAWATCTGVVYPSPVRNENAVHSLEHGAVWVTYDPSQLIADEVAALESKIDKVPYALMSPYPGMDTAISLQSWGRQLKLDDVSDERIGQFLTALRQNPNTHPEIGASCSTAPRG
nr:DUF3105 domain-containing protein [Tomitella biformata]